MHDKPAHIVSDVAKADFDRGSGDTDGSDFHAHTMFLIGKDMLNKGPDF